METSGLDPRGEGGTKEVGPGLVGVGSSSRRRIGEGGAEHLSREDPDRRLAGGGESPPESERMSTATATA